MRRIQYVGCDIDWSDPQVFLHELKGNPDDAIISCRDFVCWLYNFAFFDGERYWTHKELQAHLYKAQGCPIRVIGPSGQVWTPNHPVLLRLADRTYRAAEQEYESEGVVTCPVSEHPAFGDQEVAYVLGRIQAMRDAGFTDDIELHVLSSLGDETKRQFIEARLSRAARVQFVPQ